MTVRGEGDSKLLMIIYRLGVFKWLYLGLQTRKHVGIADGSRVVQKLLGIVLWKLVLGLNEAVEDQYFHSVNEFIQ